MQIEGMNEFFSKIAPRNGAAGVQSNTFLSALTQQKQPAYDSLFLSDIGKRLNLNARESSSLIKGRKAELTTDSLPPWAKKLDKAMSQTIDILERMQELAIAAQNKKISDLDRVEMQIEIEDLRSNLMAMPMNVRRNARGKAQLARLPTLNLQELSVIHEDYNYSNGDCSSVLGRMRERIISGQEWNVREAWCPDGFTRVTYDDNGEEILEVFEAKTWYVVDDSNVLTNRRGGGYVDSGEKVSTVREILEWANPVIVMDAESATEGARYLERQIASVQKWREQLPANLEHLSTDKAAAFLETIAFPGGVIRDPLTEMTSAHAFLHRGKLYDDPWGSYPVLFKRDDGSVELIGIQDDVDGSIELIGDREIGDILENNGYLVSVKPIWLSRWPSNILENNAADYGMNKWDDNDEERIYGDSVPKLSEESLTTTVTSKEVKVVYVKGLSLFTQ